uniref:Uncharacterized protein n=1 Tax=Panagrolaimus sp. PS1159 TaxID=55785 RepID=A0AC35FES9_9BILA
MSSHPASDGESTLSLVTARSSSLSSTQTDSSISGDDNGKKKTLPKREKEHHGGAGDNIGRNYHDQSPTSHQVTTSLRRIPRQSKDYGTPQPKRQLGGMGGYASSYFSQSKPHDQVALDDIDVLLYSVKELCALLESQRFVCGPTFMAQSLVLPHRLLYVTRNLSQRCRQNGYSPLLVKPSLYDSLLRVP